MIILRCSLFVFQIPHTQLKAMEMSFFMSVIIVLTCTKLRLFIQLQLSLTHQAQGLNPRFHESTTRFLID